MVQRATLFTGISKHKWVSPSEVLLDTTQFMQFRAANHPQPVYRLAKSIMLLSLKSRMRYNPADEKVQTT